jgi:LysM domain
MSEAVMSEAVMSRAVMSRATTGIAAMGAADRAPRCDDAVGLRLTRRGRVVVMCVAGIVGLACLFAAQGASAGTSAGAIAVTSRTVAAGETLWDIASGMAEPGQDVRDVVDELVELNGMGDSSLRAGQELLIPVP